MALERSGTPQPPYAPDPYKWVGLRVQFSVYGLPPKYLRFIGRGPSVPAAVLGTVEAMPAIIAVANMVW